MFLSREGSFTSYIVQRYDAVNAMLLNEFLKEQRKVEQQRKDFEAALANQQKQIEALTPGPTEGERTTRTKQTRTANGSEQSVITDNASGGEDQVYVWRLPSVSVVKKVAQTKLGISISVVWNGVADEKTGKLPMKNETISVSYSMENGILSDKIKVTAPSP